MAGEILEHSRPVRGVKFTSRIERERYRTVLLSYLKILLTLFVAWGPIGYWSFGGCHGLSDFVAGNDFPYGMVTSTGLRIVSMFSCKGLEIDLIEFFRY